MRFRAIKAAAKSGLVVAKTGSRGVGLVTRPLRGSQGKRPLAKRRTDGSMVARLRVGAYGEHCWSVGGGTVHALELIIPLAKYFDVDLLLPPRTPLASCLPSAFSATPRPARPSPWSLTAWLHFSPAPSGRQQPANLVVAPARSNCRGSVYA